MTISTTMQQRRDTAANWTSTNPILAAGEIGIETDTNKMKVGNGSSTWSNLDYVSGNITVDTDLSASSVNPIANMTVYTALSNKQDKLISGTNIKTINDESVLGSGDITIKSSIFEDIEELPELILNTATEVPSSGIVEKVYFNTKLTVEETDKILSSLNYCETIPGVAVPSVAVYTNSDMSVGLGISMVRYDNLRPDYSITYFDEANQINQEIYYSAAPVNGGERGWSVDEIIINLSNELSTLAPQVGMEIQNDKLKNLISTTPFETKNEDVELDKIYRVPTEHAIGGGAVIPNSGTVGKVYFNTNLSDSEVEALLSQLNYDDGDGGNFWLRTADDSIVIGAMGLPPQFVIVDFKTQKIYWCNQAAVDSMGGNSGVTQAGWQTFDNPIEINKEVLSQQGDAPVGAQNDLIKDLVFTEPFIKGEALAYKYHRVIDNKWEEVLGKNNIIDVEELPETTVTIKNVVPNYGTVEKVYFNTDLSIAEVEALLDKLTDRDSVFNAYSLLRSSDNEISLVAIRQDGMCAIGDSTTNIYYWANETAANTMGITAGWQSFTNPLTINKEVVSEYNEVFIGTQNNLISELFYIPTTTTVIDPNVELNKIYRVPNYSLGGGAVVPNSGTVGKVYFNTDLSDEQIETILSQLTYNPNLEYMNIWVCTADMSYALGAMGAEGAYGILNPATQKVYWANQAAVDLMGAYFGVTTAGWQTFDNPVEVNLEVVSSMDGDGDGTAETPIGTQNDLIKELFYTEPLVEPELLGYKYYRVIDGEWKEVLGEVEEVDLSSYEKIKTAITVPQPGETDGFTFTDSQIELIKSGNAVLQFTDNMNITHKINHVGALGEAPLFMGIIYMYFVFAIVVYMVDYENKTIAGAIGQSLISDVDLRLNGYKNNEWVDDNRNYENAYMQLEAWNGEENLSYFDLAKVIVGDSEDTADQPTFYGVKKRIDENKSFVDVEELPLLNYSVPTYRYVEKIYLNKNLSNEEMVEIFERVVPEKLGIIWLNDDVLGVLTVEYNNTNNSWQIQTDSTTIANPTVLWNQQSGWLVDYSEIILNATNYAEYAATINNSQKLLVGDKLSDIFATKPFDTEPEYKLDKIYRTPENKIISGTAVPNSGAINNLYFNTLLNDEEIKKIINQLQWIDGATLGHAGIEFYPILAYMNGDYPYALIFQRYEYTGVVNLFIINFATMEPVYNFYVEVYGGWLPFENPYSINTTLLPELSGIPLGSQNELLKTLISNTPFEKEIVGYNYERAINGKWIEVLNEVNPTYIIDKNYDDVVGDNTLTFTPSEWEIIRNNSNVKLRATLLEANVERSEMLLEKSTYMKTSIAELVMFQSTMSMLLSQDVFITTVTVIKSTEGHQSKHNEYSLTLPTTSTIDESDKLPTSKAVKTYVDESKSFVDVDVLPEVSSADLTKVYRVPEYDWVGTEVPSSGTIEKVYINTQLSNEEITSICESLDMVEIQGYLQCPILTNADMSAHLTLLYNSNTNYGFVLNGNIGGTSVDYWYSAQGWVNRQSEITVGFETYLEALAPQVGATVQNDKITKFISSTPFTRTGALLGYKHYRVINGQWVEVLQGKENYVIDISAASFDNDTISFTDEEWDIIANQPNVIIRARSNSTDTTIHSELLLEKNFYLYGNGLETALFSVMHNFFIDSIEIICVMLQKQDGQYSIRQIDVDFNSLLTTAQTTSTIDTSSNLPTAFAVKNYVDGQAPIIEKTAADLASSTPMTDEEWEIIWNKDKVILKYIADSLEDGGGVIMYLHKTSVFQWGTIKTAKFSTLEYDPDFPDYITVMNVSIANNNGTYSLETVSKPVYNNGVNETKVNELIEAYMSTNYDNGDTEEF